MSDKEGYRKREVRAVRAYRLKCKLLCIRLLSA